MYEYGADFVGADISENQIEAAKVLAKENKQNIQFIVSPAEDIDFPQDSFDVITACQCFFYFHYETVIPNFARMLKRVASWQFYIWSGFRLRIKSQKQVKTLF